jgi:hypothetical protein
MLLPRAALPDKSVNADSYNDGGDTGEQDSQAQRHRPGRKQVFQQLEPGGFAGAVPAAALRALMVLVTRSGCRPGVWSGSGMDHDQLPRRPGRHGAVVSCGGGSRVIDWNNRARWFYVYHGCHLSFVRRVRRQRT